MLAAPFAHSQSALRLGTNSQVTNTIIFENPDAKPVSEGVNVRFSASDSVLPIGENNLHLPITPFSNSFRVAMTSLVFDRGNRLELGVSDTVDLDFKPRVSCENLDIGAFEHYVLPTEITVQPFLVGRVCEGNLVELFVNATGEPGSLSFQWQRNGENLVGETSQSLVITDVSKVDTGYYRVIVFGACCNDTSDIVRLDVDLRPMLVAMNDTTIASGESVTLYIIDSIGTVVWFENDKETVVTNLTISNITAPMQFFAVATNGVCADTISIPVFIFVEGFDCRVVSFHSDTTICSGEPLRLLIEEATVTAHWVIAGTTEEIPSGTIVHPTETTHFVLVGINESGEICYSDTLVVTVPEIEFMVRADGTFCRGSAVPLFSVPPAGGWFDADDNLLGSGNITITPPLGTTTIYTAEHIDFVTGCAVRKDVAITINPPDLSLLLGDFVEFGHYTLTVCEGDVVHLQTNIDPSLVVWVRLSDNDTLDNPRITATETDVFRAHAWDPICGDIHIDLTLIVEPMPDFRILPHGRICSGTTLHIATVPAASQWFSGGERVFMPITLNETQTFIGVFISGHCEVRDTITLTAIPWCEDGLELDFEVDYGCFDGDARVEVIPRFGIAPFTFLWLDSGDTTAVVENLSPGAYTVRVTDSMGFVGEETVIVGAVTPMQIVYLMDRATNRNCDNASVRVTIANGEAPFLYEWTGWDNDIVSRGRDLTHQPSGIYTLLVTDARGCYVRQQIMLRCEFERIMPSILLTPNNDGLNDFVYIQYIEMFPINTVTIINSYGEKIITIENYNNRDRVWDGRNRRGQFVPDGTYYYVVQAEGYPPMAGWIVVRLSPGR